MLYISYIFNITAIASLIIGLIALAYGLYSLKIYRFNKGIRTLSILLGVLGLSVSIVCFYLANNTGFLSIFHF